ncbi:MAG TPA: histidine kinase dimerization/phospho-acceptor domain-containing protein [Pyrinomonadaceae bacterium]|nr:histidine kinase dimerization/phospho-acceptor domain-containing protein [Pyrinomonadaceae bacterium]
MKSTTEFPQTPTPIQKTVLTYDGSGHESLTEISHELRTPLNVIIGICQLLQRDRRTPLTPLQRDAVDRMDRNARALLHSVNRLIDELRQNSFH